MIFQIVVGPRVTPRLISLGYRLSIPHTSIHLFSLPHKRRTSRRIKRADYYRLGLSRNIHKNRVDSHLTVPRSPLRLDQTDCRHRQRQEGRETKHLSSRRAKKATEPCLIPRTSMLLIVQATCACAVQVAKSCRALVSCGISLAFVLEMS